MYEEQTAETMPNLNDNDNFFYDKKSPDANGLFTLPPEEYMTDTFRLGKRPYRKYPREYVLPSLGDDYSPFWAAVLDLFRSSNRGK